MKKKTLIILLIFIILIGGLLLIFKQIIFVQKGDPIFIDATCAAPCLLGITPGVTTESEAKSIIKEDTRFENCQEFDNTASNGVRWIQCDEIGLVLSDNKEISRIGFTSTRVKLEDIIDKFGDPDKMSIFFANRSNDPLRVEVVLFYQKIQTQVNLIEKKGESYKISPKTHVISVTFFSLEEYDSKVKEHWVTWNGYGRYEPSSP